MVCLTGYKKVIKEFFNIFLPQIKIPIIMITLETDNLDITSSMLDHSNISKWYTWNKPFNHSKLVSIPIGLNKSRHFKPFLEFFSLDNKIEKDRLLLANFSKHTHSDREKIIKSEWSSFCLQFGII